MSQDHGTGQEGAGDLTHDEKPKPGIAAEPKEERGRPPIEDEFLGDDKLSPELLENLRRYARSRGMPEHAVRLLR